jgi:hypothetical protein
MRSRMYGLLAAGTVCLLASTSALALDPGPKCEASKLGTMATYAQCRLKADAKAVKKATTADYSKCNLDKFTKAEDAGGMDCPTTTDQTTVSDYLDDCTMRAAQWLAGDGGLPDTCEDDLAACEANSGGIEVCGDGVIDPGEECDFGDLDGKDCTSQLGEEAVGALGCASDTCLFDTSGCQARYEKQNVGDEPTVVDHLTGLEWVVTNDSGSGLLDKDNRYTWSTEGSNDADGTAFTVYIAGLNGDSYGGHNDWRLPRSGGCCGIGPFAPAELESIVDCSFGNPCIDEVLFGDTASSFYWSSTTVASNPDFAWFVDFFVGGVNSVSKRNGRHVRAVRGGL